MALIKIITPGVKKGHQIFPLCLCLIYRMLSHNSKPHKWLQANRLESCYIYIYSGNDKSIYMIKINVAISITHGSVFTALSGQTCCCQQTDWRWDWGSCVCVCVRTNLNQVHGFTFTLPSVKPCAAVRMKFGFPLYWLEFTRLPWWPFQEAHWLLPKPHSTVGAQDFRLKRLQHLMM